MVLILSQDLCHIILKSSQLARCVLGWVEGISLCFVLI